MKYVIKEDKSNSFYVYLFPNTTAFTRAFTLPEATPFDSLAEAIHAIVLASKLSTIPRYTVVGVKEVMKPTYEEVEL